MNLNLIDRGVDRVSNWQLANERRGVTRSTAMRLYGRLLLVAGAIILAVRAHGVVAAVGIMLLAGSAGAGITSGITRCHAWRRGYLAAQKEMLDRGVEAADQGLTFDTWAQQELLQSMRLLR